MDTRHLISKDKSLLEALSLLNTLYPDPLVLFVIDEDNRMVGTLTDGDSRRALISGASVHDKAEKIMHRDFNYMSVEDACKPRRTIFRFRRLTRRLCATRRSCAT